jgi:hypothetical protein
LLLCLGAVADIDQANQAQGFVADQPEPCSQERAVISRPARVVNFVSS